MTIIPPNTAGLDPAEARSFAARQLEQNVVLIPDFPSRGVTYLDFYRTFDQHPVVRRAVIDCFLARYRGWNLDAVAGIGNGGFTVASLVAFALEVPFHPMRKAGDTVFNAIETGVDMVYAERTVTIAADIVRHQSRVLLIDDTIATGGTSIGAIGLLQSCGAEVVELATVFETRCKGGRAAIEPTNLFSILSRETFEA